MKNSQKIAAGVLAAVVVTSGAAALPVLNADQTSVSLTASAANDAITITNGTEVPSTVVQGSAVGVQGVVSSESSNITSVTVGIYDSSRKLVTGKSALPKTKTYDISKLNNYVSFAKLAPGSYTYMVFATNDTNTNYVLTNKSFTVSTTAPTNTAAAETPSENAPAAEGTTEAAAENTTEAAKQEETPAAKTDMSISNGTVLPAAMKTGSYATVKGTVTSADSNITAVSAGVYDEDGKQVTGDKAEVNAKSFSLAKLDANITFNTLKEGTYTYKVIASNGSAKDAVLTEQKFYVTKDGKAPAEAKTEEAKTEEKTTTAENAATVSNSADALTIANATQVPDKLAKGKSVLVKGTVTSASSNIESLTVGIYDTTGKLISGKTAIPSGKTYDISKLDNYIEFNKLNDGTYAFMVFATNASNKNYVMVNKAFTVGEGGQVASDAIAIANGTTVPSTISVGKGVIVKGTVASANSNITSLTVGVYDQNNKQVTGKTVEPNAKTYNVGKIDSFITFDKLAAGSYNYKVIATNGANKDYELVNQSFNVSDGKDVMTIANGTAIPDTLKKGSCLAVKGVVTSASSDMTSVTVGVYDSNKKLVTGKTAVPNAKTYDISKLDNYVEFNKLPEGTYTYMVFANNAVNSNYVVFNKNFTVGNATSSNTASNTASNSTKGVTLNGGTSIPETISKGSPVTVKGTVSSNDTIKAVTVAVYNSNNQLVTSKSVAPNAKSYDLNKVDKFIEFNKLGAGKYTYRVAVTTTANKDVTADRQVFNVK